MGKIIQTAGRNALGEFAPEFAHLTMMTLHSIFPAEVFLHRSPLLRLEFSM